MIFLIVQTVDLDKSALNCCRVLHGILIAVICLTARIYPLQAQNKDDQVTPPDSLKSENPWYKPASHEGYKLTVNADANFAFEIPKKWKATDNGAKTEGYFLIPPDTLQSVVISISNTPVIGKTDAFVGILKRQYDMMKQYQHFDGTSGYHFIKEEEELYARIEEQQRILMLVDAPAYWRDVRHDTLHHIAQSIRFGSYTRPDSLQ